MACTFPSLDNHAKHQNVVDLIPCLSSHDQDILKTIIDTMIGPNTRASMMQPQTKGRSRGASLPNEDFTMSRTHLSASTYQLPNGPLPRVPPISTRPRAGSFSTTATAERYHSARSSFHQKQNSSISSSVATSEESGYVSQTQLQRIIATQFPSPPPSAFGSSTRLSMVSSVSPFDSPQKPPYTSYPPQLLVRRDTSPEPSLVSPTTQSSLASSYQPPTPQTGNQFIPQRLSDTKSAGQWSHETPRPSLASSAASSFSFPARNKKAIVKKTRLVQNPQASTSFMNLSDDDEDAADLTPAPKKTSNYPNRMSNGSRAVYRDPSLDVPRDVGSSYQSSARVRNDRGSYASREFASSAGYPTFQQPKFQQTTFGVDNHSTSGSVYSSFSRPSSRAYDGVYAYATTTDSQPYHTSLRETLTPTLRTPVPERFGNQLLTPSTMSFETSSDRRSPSLRSSGQSSRSSNVSGKMSSKMRSLLGFPKRSTA